MANEQEILRETEIKITDRTPWVSTDLLSCKESIIESCNWWDSDSTWSWSYAEWIYSIEVPIEEQVWFIDNNDAIAYREAIQSESFWDYGSWATISDDYKRAKVIPVALWQDYYAVFREWTWSSYNDTYCHAKKINETLWFDNIAWAVIRTENNRALTWASMYHADLENGIYKCIVSFALHFQQMYSWCALKTVEIDVNAWTITVLHTYSDYSNYYLPRYWWPISYIDYDEWTNTARVFLTWNSNISNWESTKWCAIIPIVNHVPMSWISSNICVSNSNITLNNFNIAMWDNLALWGDKDSICLVDTSPTIPVILQTINQTITWNTYYQWACHINNNKALLICAWGSDMKAWIVEIDRTWPTPTMTLWPEHINYAAEWLYYSLFPTRVDEENMIVLSRSNSAWGGQWADIYKMTVDWTNITFWEITEFLPQAEMSSNDTFLGTSYILINGRLTIFYRITDAVPWSEIKFINYENVDIPWGYITTDAWDWTRQNFIWFAMNSNFEWNPETETWVFKPVEIDISPLLDRWIESWFTPWADVFLSGVWWISQTWNVKIGKALNAWIIRTEAN